jgi:hypothetical protein
MARKTKIELEVDGDKILKTLTDVDKKLQSIDDTSKDSVKSMGKMEKATQGLKKGFNGIGLAIKAAGIGLVLKAMDLLFDVFKQNQAVVDGMAVGFETISIVFNELVTAIIDTVTKLNELTGGFDATKRVIMNVIKVAIAPLKLQFYAIKLAVQEAQLIWEKSIFGDGDTATIDKLNKGIAETKATLYEIATEAVDAGKNIGKDFVEAVGEIGSLAKASIEGISKISITAAFETAKTNTALSKSAAIAQAEQGKLMKQYMQQAEIQRQIRDNTSMSIQERIEANNRLNDVLDKQEESMIKQADLILANAEAQYKKNASDENYIALLEAETNKLDVLEDLEGKRSEQLINEVGLKKELLTMSQAVIESDITLALNKKKFAAELENNEVAQLEMKRTILEEEKVIELERLQNVIDSYKLGTQERIDAQIAYNVKSEELNQQTIVNEKALAKSKKQIQLDTATAAVNAAGQLFGILSSMSEGNFEEQKKYQIAGAITQGLMGIIGAWAGAFMTPAPTPVQLVLAGISSALMAGAMIANVSKIKNTKPGTGGAPSGGGAPSAPTTAPHHLV